MKQEKGSWRVRLIQVKDTAGDIHQVEEIGDFIRVKPLNGPWTEWLRSSGRYRLNGQPVNATDDPNTLQIAMTGELLTVLNPSE
jgi:hypothetical protein